MHLLSSDIKYYIQQQDFFAKGTEKVQNENFQQ